MLRDTRAHVSTADGCWPFIVKCSAAAHDCYSSPVHSSVLSRTLTSVQRIRVYWVPSIGTVSHGIRSLDPCPVSHGVRSLDPCATSHRVRSLDPCPVSRVPRGPLIGPVSREVHTLNPCPASHRVRSLNPCPARSTHWTRVPCPTGSAHWTRVPRSPLIGPVCSVPQGPLIGPVSSVSRGPLIGPVSHGVRSLDPCPVRSTHWTRVQRPMCRWAVADRLTPLPAVYHSWRRW